VTVTICDVGPRDGLHNEPGVLAPSVRFESSVGGLGGCPFAPRAAGKDATEDLVYLLHAEGVETGVDLDALIAVSEWLESVLGRELPGQVYRAGSFVPVAG
jgi:isopropylmalate/homocitrate/citramalate synthase